MNAVSQIVDFGSMFEAEADAELSKRLDVALAYYSATPVGEPIFEELTGEDQKRESPAAYEAGLRTRRVTQEVEEPTAILEMKALLRP